MKLIKKKLPTKVEPKKLGLKLPLKPMKFPEGPLPSKNGAKVVGALSAPDPKLTTFAKDMQAGVVYSNVWPGNIANPYMSTKFVKRLSETNKVLVAFYAGSLKQWLQVDVAEDWPMTTDPKYLEAMCKPEIVDPEIRKKRAAHLKPFQKKAAPVVVGKPDGKRCMFGMIGGKKVLCDAGDGKVLGTYDPKTFDAEKEAKKLKRELVPQAKAAPEAMVALRRAWAEAQAKRG